VSAHSTRVALTAAVLLLVAVLPSSAWAHAQLESTTPQRGALVATQPKAISLTFDEPVTGTAGAIRVFDRRGDRVDDGNAYHPGAQGQTFAVGLKPGLAKGTYTATYRVVSADTHIVTGGFVFSIGSRSASVSSTVGQLLAGQKTGRVTTWAFAAVRGVQYGTIGIGVGLLVFLLAVWLPVLRRLAGTTEEWEHATTAFVARLQTGLLAASLAGCVTALLGLGLQGAESAGVPLWSVSGDVLGDVLGTRFGTVWAAGAVAWLLIAGATLGARAGRLRLTPLLVPAIALVFLPALAGHASVQRPVWLFLPANLIHVGAMSVWIGGLTALLVCLPVATRKLANADRSRLLADVLARFSPLALGCVIALAASGVTQALVQIDAWNELWNTSYGRAVLVKAGLLAGLVALGAVNRRRTLPRLRRLADEGVPPGVAGLVLRRTLRAEVATIAVVLGTTGALAGYAPAKTLSTGPVQITSTIGPAQLSLDVDPAQVGANDIHLYLFDAMSGAQYTATKELTVTATLPSKGIGPLTLQTHDTGPGHYTIPAAVLGAPGTWTLALTVRVSDFDQYERRLQVRIR
jgi:copper transport protein